MISCPIRLENNQVWDNGLRPVDSESLDWQLGPLGFGYILQLRCCQATSSKNAHHNTRTDVPPPARQNTCRRSPKFTPPLAQASPLAHPATQEHATTKEKPRSSMLPHCPGDTRQNLWCWCLLYTMYCEYRYHIGPGCTGQLHRRLGSTRLY